MGRRKGQALDGRGAHAGPASQPKGAVHSDGGETGGTDTLAGLLATRPPV